MLKPVRIYMENGDIVLKFRLYLDIRTEDRQLARELILSGIKRAQEQSPYSVRGRDVNIRVETEETEAFSLDAVNVRVYDITPVVRKRFSPKRNVSRAFLGAAHIWTDKLTRRIVGMPDVYINIAGRDIASARGMLLMQSVVLHEFMHVISFKDKYKGRGEKQKKLNKRVQDRDIMYRTGGSQRLMEYQVKRLLDCAERGKLPIRLV